MDKARTLAAQPCGGASLDMQRFRSVRIKHAPALLQLLVTGFAECCSCSRAWAVACRGPEIPMLTLSQGKRHLGQLVVQRGKLAEHALRDRPARRGARAACARVHEVVVLRSLRARVRARRPSQVIYWRQHEMPAIQMLCLAQQLLRARFSSFQ